VLDPRGLRQRSTLTLATRPDRNALAAGTILFYDNTKMDVGHFGEIFRQIKQGLRKQGIANFSDHRETIRGKSEADIETLAQKFRNMNVSGAVIGLADMGVCPAIVALTIAMERAGIPTVCLTAGPGSALAVAYTHYRAGALCLLPFDIYQGSSLDTIITLSNAGVERIVAMLTSNGATLQELAAIDYAIDRDPASSNATLALAGTAGDSVPFDEVAARFDELHIGDGLPCVPPTAVRYARMREFCPFDPTEVIMQGIGPSGAPITVRDALIAAVMAGCKPEYMPVVLTALRAIARPAYGLLQAVTTSFAGGHFVLASGPLAGEIGMHGGQGCLGPGFRANATIGRAINLLLLNVCRAVPGHADLACLSSPAEYTYCMAEDASLSPWLPMNVEQYDASATCVMLMQAESPHSVLDLVSTSAAHLLETIIDCCTTLGSNNAYMPGSLVLLLNPDHARLLADDGYDKQRLREEIHRAARIKTALLAGRGLGGIRPKNETAEYQPVTRSPDDIVIVVGGGKGGHSAVILPWALHSDAVFEAVRLPDGNYAKTIADFRQNQAGY
jgi:hypothetical protein